MSFMVTDGVYIEVNPFGVVLLTVGRPNNKADSGGHDVQLNIANTTRPPTVVACTAETNRRAAVWSSAVRLAAAREARLILYDTDASSIWTSPFPEFDAGRYEHPLSPSELRELGRVVLGLLGGVMVASARPKAHLVSPFLSVDSLQQETAKR
jgi:hypothetical protein